MIDESYIYKLANNLTTKDFEKAIFDLKYEFPLHQDITEEFFPYCQGKTGYCWLEAMLQCISLYKKNETKENFLFDDKYLMFFDKLEKANLFFENIISNIAEDVKGKNNSYILHNAMTDRGQWQMGVNLIRKYGLVLKNDTANITPKKTVELNIYISYLLRMGAYEIRQKHDSDIDGNIILLNEIKDKIIQNIFDVLVAFYGKQYEKIDLPTYENMNPVEFSKKKIKFPFHEFVSVYPTENMTSTETEMYFDGNIYEYERNKFLGVSNEMFGQLLESQIKYYGFCWCSGDFGKFYIKKYKLLDDSYFANDEKMGNNKIMNFNRTMAFDYHIAGVTHAVVLTRKNYDYYVYDSSFKDDAGAACWVSKSWINKYLLQVVVHKKYLNGVVDITRVQEYPWDFFGV